jgi:two-component system, NtrC family, nitrogen regulation sensor histidine kinase NtrY
MRGAGLRLQLAALLWAVLLLGLLLHGAITQWPGPQLLLSLNRLLGTAWQAPAPFGVAALLGTSVLALPLCVGLAGAGTAPIRRLLRALQGAVLSYREGDYSVSIAAGGRGELGELLRLHNELGQALHSQRHQLAQRELLLDTVVQNTPLSLLLCDASGTVVYANLAARQLLLQGRKLAGQPLVAVLASAPEALRAALQSGQDQLVTVSEEQGGDEQFHVSQRSLALHGQQHRLLLLRRMTRELAREEVASWKRVLRVISHELNNSLAPISSLAHSGAELARRGELQRLPPVFERIAERAAHLHGFLAGYASFAKLPQPRVQAVAWAEFVARLSAHCSFVLDGAWPEQAGAFDTGQIEQAVINLVKNAHESGSAPEQVSLALQQNSSETRITVADRGSGMSQAVLAQALLPFYSTKRSGTGLGLALVREITEAHGGQLTLANREGGGLAVTLVLPAA